ncbi:MAG: aminotransferase class I/II-fold pyridoxal phosphate-dependent enzyme [Prochloraceae cyanobacterium]|nr:aminotransferase class I/II-fold pyridoxal phosphate-dependent enzyme [Prochloraceae cyanobacterium]
MDNVNYSAEVFPEVLSVPKLVSIFSPEPGYHSPDGSLEADSIVRRLEAARLQKAGLSEREAWNRVFTAGVGLGNGCSNVICGLLRSMSELSSRSQNKAERNEVLIFAPCYTVYSATCWALTPRLRSRLVSTTEERGFLPTRLELERVARESTLAVILAVPGNPAQTSYGSERTVPSHELREIVTFCQSAGIYLILDSIYQDLMFDNSENFIEPFEVTEDPTFITKVYGCSKDTPFFSGYRTGYWIGDPSLVESYRRFISASQNSPHTLSLLLFAVNLLFKALRLERRLLETEDLEVFNRGLLGWNRRIDVRSCTRALQSNNIFEIYEDAIRIAEDIQRKALAECRLWGEGSPVIQTVVNNNIGHLLWFRVEEEVFPGDDVAFFNFMARAGVGIIPGSAFGVPRKSGGLWFRITTIHEPLRDILKGLELLEAVLLARTSH